MRTHVKICGITNEADLDCAIAAGVDAVGFIMVASSPRNIDAETAAALVERVPAFVTTVGLFADDDPSQVARIVERVGFDLLQFQGDEPEAVCRQFGRRYIKGIRVGADTDLPAMAQRYASATGLLLDALVAGAYGGTGHTFDWDLVPELDRPVILAGGLNPGNVAQAIAKVKPWSVDVCSGVEAEKGIKDSEKIKAFMAAVRAADGDTR